MMQTEHRVRVDEPQAFGKVAVLLGGQSAERDISLMSGEAVLKALRARGVDAHPVDAADDLVGILREQHFERAWIALHGRGGEDGTVQGLLEIHGYSLYRQRHQGFGHQHGQAAHEAD